MSEPFELFGPVETEPIAPPFDLGTPPGEAGQRR